MKSVSGSCIQCCQSFDNVKKGPKGLCKVCYSKGKRKSKMPKWQDMGVCRECQIAWNKLDKKGRIVEKMANGYCKRCYGRQFARWRPCQSCGLEIRAVAEFCKACKEDLSPEDRALKLKVLSKNKLMTGDFLIMNNWQYEEARRLLLKFKIGSQNEPDHYRVVNLFIDIWGYEAFYDSYLPHAQVVIMLRKLKNLWWYNNDLRKEEAKINI